MENAIILHGTSCTPDSFWLPSIIKYLKKIKYDVWAPELPEADHPELRNWLPKVLGGGILIHPQYLLAILPDVHLY